MRRIHMWAVYHRTSYTGDEPRAIFRWSVEADHYVSRIIAHDNLTPEQAACYTVEPFAVQVDGGE